MNNTYEELIDLLKSGKIDEAREILRSLIRRDDAQGLARFLESVKKNSKALRNLCSFFSELGAYAELWYNSLPILMRFVGENCGEAYLADFRIVLKSTLVLRGRICDLNLYELVGGKLVRILEFLLNKTIREELGLELDDVFSELISNDEIKKRLVDLRNSIPIDARELLNKLGIKTKLLEIAEGVRISLLLMDRLYTEDFSRSFTESLERIASNFDEISAFIGFYLMPWLRELPKDKLLDILVKAFTNLNTSIACVAGIVFSIWEMLGLEWGFSLSGVLKTLINFMNLSPSDIIKLYNLVRSGQFRGAFETTFKHILFRLLDHLDATIIVNQLRLLWNVSSEISGVIEVLNHTIRQGKVDEHVLEFVLELIEWGVRNGEMYSYTVFLETLWSLIVYGGIPRLRRMFKDKRLFRRLLTIMANVKDKGLLLSLTSFLKNIWCPELSVLFSIDEELIKTFNEVVENLSKVVGNEDARKLLSPVVRVE